MVLMVVMMMTPTQTARENEMRTKTLVGQGTIKRHSYPFCKMWSS